MKSIFLFFFFIICTVNIFGQSRKGIFFREKKGNKIIRLFFDDRTEFKIKDSYLKQLSDSIQAKHGVSGSLISILKTASTDTLYFDNALHIPINQVEWIYAKSNSYYAKVIIFTMSMSLLGFFNYGLLYNNESNGLIITGTICMGVIPLIMIPVTIKKNVVYPEKWEPIAIVRNRNEVFKPGSKTHTIFDRLELPSPQRK